MKRSDIFLWIMVILFIGFLYWMISTGRLQEVTGQFVDGYWKFLENIMNIRARR